MAKFFRALGIILVFVPLLLLLLSLTPLFPPEQKYDAEGILLTSSSVLVGIACLIGSNLFSSSD